MKGLCCLLLAACIGAVSSADAEHVNGLGPVLVEGEPAPEGLDDTLWEGWSCQEFTQGCPSGEIRSQDYNYRGCSSPSSGVCTGECQSCAGSGFLATLCQIDTTEGAECAIFITGGQVDCGQSRKHPCIWLTSVGLGGPPNHCGCNTSIVNSTGGRCKIPQCG